MFYNINPELWGPSCWKFLHYLTIAYPDKPGAQDKNKMKSFFESFSCVIPCETCRVHFGLNLKKFPLTNKVLESKYNLINWLNDIHNEVNMRTGKKTFTYDEIIKEYENKESSKDYSTEIVTVVLLVLIIIIILIYIKIKI